ncbi:hypothetical protein [Virgibacillus sp. CBA3643]|uniref:hypothetical protein n=1 Tax=Virgibacillus sp. CBA3643 TaxID=2942278 RepID=UPI0035A32560
MQLGLFDDTSSESEVIIPKEVISPLESNRKIMSNPFVEERDTFISYVKGIQRQHNCSWHEARKMFYAYRDKQAAITIKGGK